MFGTDNACRILVIRRFCTMSFPSSLISASLQLGTPCTKRTNNDRVVTNHYVIIRTSK